MRAAPLVGIVLLAIALTSAGARAPGPPPGYGQEWYERALDQAASAGMFGGFQIARDQVVGTFLEVTIDGAAGVLRDYTAKKAFGDVLVFSRIEVANVSFAEPQVQGSVVTIVAAEATVTVHNSALAALVVESRATTNVVTYTLGPGIVASLSGNLAMVVGNGLRGGVVSLDGGTLSLMGGQIVATLPAGAATVFRAHLVAGEGVVGGAEQDALLDALASERLAAEDLSVRLDGGVAQDTVAYVSILVRVSVLEGGAIQAIIDASLPSGRSVALHLHRGLFDNAPTPDLTVELDGRLLPRAGSAPEALFGPEGKYHVTTSLDGVLVIVHMPSFSTHTIVVRLANGLPLLPLGTAGFISIAAALGATGAAGLAAVRRGRRKW